MYTDNKSRIQVMCIRFFGTPVHTQMKRQFTKLTLSVLWYTDILFFSF